MRRTISCTSQSQPASQNNCLTLRGTICSLDTTLQILRMTTPLNIISQSKATLRAMLSDGTSKRFTQIIVKWLRQMQLKVLRWTQANLRRVPLMTSPYHHNRVLIQLSLRLLRMPNKESWLSNWKMQIGWLIPTRRTQTLKLNSSIKSVFNKSHKNQGVSTLCQLTGLMRASSSVTTRVWAPLSKLHSLVKGKRVNNLSSQQSLSRLPRAQ